ncbi:AraC family transcriptional regulator ligand-binding domain-containing protein [Tropicimonas sp. S265A]|uniref:AraC family transcriptional regulator n=1 Tax=Tropicimonas sp. S265A TaxID=3415134 RepID=UPI003C7DE5FF
MSSIGPTVLLVSDLAQRLRHSFPQVSIDALSDGLDLPDLASAAPETRISVHDEAAFVQRACEATGDIDFGFDAGLSHNHPSNLPGYIARHSPTLREGILAARRYTSTVRPGLEFSLRETGNIAALTLDITDPKLRAFSRYFEMIYGAVTTQIRNFTGRAFYPDGLSFTHARTAPNPKVRARIGCDIEFSATRIEMLIGHATLDAPMISRDDLLRAFLMAEGDRALDAMQMPARTIEETVELLVEGCFPDRLPSLGEIAQEMGLSTRSLSRRLQEAQTSFKEILSHVRLRLAMRELTESDMPVSQTAYRLGYANQSAFATAFRRETGLSPSAYRKKQIAAREALAGQG